MISVILAAAAGLAAAGCTGAPRADLGFVSAKARRDGDIYAVTAVIENRTPVRVALDAMGIEMTTFDAAGKTLSRAYPFSFRGDVEPLASTRLPLNHPDRGRRVRSSRLALVDDRGRTVSEIDVGSPEEEAPGAAVERAPPDPFPMLSGRR